MLQLEAMTLRGVGSYIRGSRLELRRLTILSGVNGSGKSTWFKTLAMLRRSVEKFVLPFAFNVDDSNPNDVGFMNYHLWNRDDLTSMADGDEENQFGPPACVGLEFVATADLRFGEPVSFGWEAENPEQRFLLEGSCLRGTRLIVRIAHPTINVDSRLRAVIPGTHHHVELRINGTTALFQRPHSPSGGNDNPADYTQHRGSPRFGQLAGPTLRDLVAKRIQQVIQTFFQGYFHISAVRSLRMEADAPPAGPPDDSHERRDVGQHGQGTLDVFRWNSPDKPQGDTVNDPGRPVVHHGLGTTVDDGLQGLLGVDLDCADDEGRLNRFTNDYLLGPQVPKQFSSGFHQLLPMIVQLGVMQPGELLSIENPEVHLHPDLQLKVSEFLLKQSRQGHGVLIETHSDLIIRRVIRAMLEEEQAFSQQQFSLNFSRPENDPGYGVGSVLTPYGIDTRGQIVWPEGFMDESINESQRLMEVMYGRRGDRHGEGEE